MLGIKGNPGKGQGDGQGDGPENASDAVLVRLAHPARPKAHPRGGAALLNAVWILLIVGGVVTAALGGRIEVVTEAAMTSAKLGLETVIALAGIMIFWLGMTKVAEEAGLIDALGRLLQPLFRFIFPDVPRDHPASGAIMLNVSANMLGLGQAATPFGLRAMEALQELNGGSDTASDAMVTFLILNTSGVTLIPATVIALRATAGSAHPAEIVGTTLFATLSSTAIALAVDALVRTARHRRSRK